MQQSATRVIRGVFAMTMIFGARAAAAQAAASVCPFTPAELKAALGVTFEAGVAGTPVKASSLVMQSCTYRAPRYDVRVTTTAYPRQADAEQHLKVMLGGTKVPIAGDPDGAVYQEGQGDNTDPVVAYARKSVAVEIRMVGLYYGARSEKDAAVKTLRAKLATLRRIP
jgi:hypothetical protein